MAKFRKIFRTTEYGDIQNKVTCCYKLCNYFLEFGFFFSLISITLPRIKVFVPPTEYISLNLYNPFELQYQRIVYFERGSGKNNLFLSNELLVIENGFPFRENRLHDAKSRYIFRAFVAEQIKLRFDGLFLAPTASEHPLILPQLL